MTSQEIHDQVKASARRCIAHAGLHHAIGQSLENLVVGMAELAMTFEREACAEIARRRAGKVESGSPWEDGWMRAATIIADDIEARGRSEPRPTKTENCEKLPEG